MITGRVTALREATIRLTVRGPHQHQQEVEAVIDTGCNGFLTLPSHVVYALQLPFVGNRRATLGDGSIVVLDLYLATVLWHAQAGSVPDMLFYENSYGSISAIAKDSPVLMDYTGSWRS